MEVARICEGEKKSKCVSDAFQVICEEVADSGAPEIDLQCREHVASDTESEAENATDLSSTSVSNEPSQFPQQRFSSPSAISQASSGSDITHRPKAIKARLNLNIDSGRKDVSIIVCLNTGRLLYLKVI